MTLHEVIKFYFTFGLAYKDFAALLSQPGQSVVSESHFKNEFLSHAVCFGPGGAPALIRLPLLFRKK